MPLNQLLQRITRARSLLGECLDLFRTLDPTATGRAKVFGRPAHSGGPATKHRLLEAACARPGEPYSQVICQSSVRVPLGVLRQLRRMGARVVVNQNGVYYPLWYPSGFAQQNAYLRALNQLADHTFFQSAFARASFVRWVGPPPPSSSLLYNAVDRARFLPDPARATDPTLIRVLLFHDFRPMNRALWTFHLRFMRIVPKVRWVVLGQRGDADLEATVRRDLEGLDVEWHLDPGADLPALVRGCDVALHFLPNDVCPNKVVECLASGVFVICTASGGSGELVANGGGEILPCEASYETHLFPSVADVQGALERFRTAPAAGREGAKRASERFDLGEWIKAMTGSPR